MELMLYFEVSTRYIYMKKPAQDHKVVAHILTCSDAHLSVISPFDFSVFSWNLQLPKLLSRSVYDLFFFHQSFVYVFLFHCILLFSVFPQLYQKHNRSSLCTMLSISLSFAGKYLVSVNCLLFQKFSEC
jgi:hypothetical protein